jgi:hypothetical protein
LLLDGAVLVVVVAQGVEVILPDIDRQVLAPIVRDATQNHPAARLERLDLVRAAADRDVERRLLEVPRLPVVLRQDGKLADDQGQLSVRPALEGELHLALADGLDAIDAGVVGAVARVALLAQGLEGKDDVFRGDRLAVMPARLRIEIIGHPGTVLGHLSEADPAAGLPRRMNGLKLSKVPTAQLRSSPPFGASGLT